MFRKFFALVVLLMFLTSSFCAKSVLAHAADEDAAQEARLKVEKLGLGSQVEVKLRDKTKLKGQISGAEQDSFTVTDKAGATRTIVYSEVAEVKKPGRGASTRNWIIIGSAIAGVLIGWTILKPALCDGGAQTRGPC